MEALETAALAAIGANAASASALYIAGLAILAVMVGGALIWKVTKRVGS